MKIAYRVAEHCFVLNIDESEEVIGQLSQYEPFKIPVSEAAHPLFELEVVDGATFMMPGTFVKESFQDDDGSQIEAGHVGEHPCFNFLLHGKRLMMRSGTVWSRLIPGDQRPESRKRQKQTSVRTVSRPITTKKQKTVIVKRKATGRAERETAERSLQ